MVKKEVFEWIRTRRKTIELRKGRPKQGNNAVFQCGRSIIRGKIVKKEEGSLTDVLRQDSYPSIIPCAHSLQEAKAYLKKLYGSTDGVFTAYYFTL